VNPLIQELFERLSTLREEAGQTMAEYAVVLGVIAIAVVAAMTALSTKISAALSIVGTKI
jgi:Flp pilus assembly pilin Flp